MEDRKLPAIDVQALLKHVEQDVQQCMQEVTEAVNSARAGSVIDDSEEAVRIATGKLRQKIFEKALQMKMDAAAAAFSPSAKRRGSKRSSS